MILKEEYLSLVAGRRVKSDAAQLEIIAKLDDLLLSLAEDNKQNSLWHRLLKKNKKQNTRGIYIYGGVGRGKSMLMDMFYAACKKQSIAKINRIHFHIFMREVHEILQRIREDKKSTKNSAQKKDPLHQVAKILSGRHKIICFDEFQVQDIADASILQRLFEALWEAGVIIIATSNRAPEQLYLGGLNRHRFLPFIARLKEAMDCVELAAAQDYRLATLRAAPRWFAPLTKTNRERLDEIFAALVMQANPLLADMRLNIDGRHWLVPACGGVARLSFADLCEQARGAADYWELAQSFHTLIIYDIPIIPADNKNLGARFIALVDALYEHKVKLIACADAAPDELYSSFEFARTASRLIEMQSEEYLAEEHVLLGEETRDSN